LGNEEVYVLVKLVEVIVGRSWNIVYADQPVAHMTFVIGIWPPTGEVGNISMVAQDHEDPLCQRI
jgi:hypothetical protein